MEISSDRDHSTDLPVPLAELTTGDLTQEQLAAWQMALQNHARELQVRLKTAGARRAQELAPTLQSGLDALLAGHAASLQVRYFYENTWWADTLLALPDGSVRLLRAPLPSMP